MDLKKSTIRYDYVHTILNKELKKKRYRKYTCAYFLYWRLADKQKYSGIKFKLKQTNVFFSVYKLINASGFPKVTKFNKSVEVNKE